MWGSVYDLIVYIALLDRSLSAILETTCQHALILLQYVCSLEPMVISFERTTSNHKSSMQPLCTDVSQPTQLDVSLQDNAPS
jgi:hypothetical protein